jgi:hypothetical protein
MIGVVAYSSANDVSDCNRENVENPNYRSPLAAHKFHAENEAYNNHSHRTKSNYNAKHHENFERIAESQQEA